MIARLEKVQILSFVLDSLENRRFLVFIGDEGFYFAFSDGLFFTPFGDGLVGFWLWFFFGRLFTRLGWCGTGFG